MSINKEVAAEMKRAEKTLAAAVYLYKNEYYEDSLSRSYYAIFHAAKAVLFQKGISANSHEAVKRLFGKELVEADEIDKEFAIILREEQDERLLADYDVTFCPESDRVKTRLDDAKKFLDKMKKYLESN